MALCKHEQENDKYKSGLITWSVNPSKTHFANRIINNNNKAMYIFHRVWTAFCYAIKTRFSVLSNSLLGDVIVRR